MINEKPVMSMPANLRCLAIFLVLLPAVLLCLPAAYSQAQKSEPPAQKSFATPKEAAEALFQATGNFDVAALKEILGPDGEDLVSSEDPVQDKNNATGFAARAREKMRLPSTPRIRSAPSFPSAMRNGHFRSRS